MNARPTRYFKDMMYCINDQSFIPSSQIPYHNPSHELITRAEFIQVMDANINACINFLKNANNLANLNLRGIKSQIDSADSQFVIYHNTLNNILNSIEPNSIQDELGQMRILHERIIAKIRPRFEYNFNINSSQKIQALESVKNILYDELADITQIPNLIGINFDNREKDILFTRRLGLPYNDQFPQFEQLNPTQTPPLGFIQPIDNPLLEQVYPSLVPPLTQPYRVSGLTRNREDKFTFYYDANRHTINLITIPNLQTKKVAFQQNSIPSVPSFAISESKLFITGGFHLDTFRQSKLTFLMNWSSVLNEDPVIRPTDSMIHPKQDHAVSLLGDQLSFTVGGLDAEKGTLRNCEKYLFNSNGWIEMPLLPEPRKEFSLCTLNDKTLYVVGGFSGDGPGTTYHKNILSLDIDFEQGGWKTLLLSFNELEWTEVTNMTAYGANPETIFIFGGRGLQPSSANITSSKNFEFNVNSGLFRILSNELNNREGDFFLGKYSNIAQCSNSIYFVSAKMQLYSFSLTERSIQSYTIERL